MIVLIGRHDILLCLHHLVCQRIVRSVANPFKSYVEFFSCEHQYPLYARLEHIRNLRYL